MKRNLNEYSKPRMVMEQFTPQEYIAGCWKCTIDCQGTPNDSHGHPQIYVFNTASPTYLDAQMIQHAPHHIDIVTWRGEGDPPNVVEYVNGTLHEFEAIVASQSAVAPGHQTFVGGKEDQYTEGYAWASEYNYCFAKVLEWVLVENRPNAS